ncbi:MAG: Asp23/Gls24 family envelope stress response protein [Oscillospiraceae bacterium]|nr:Asp23/Gls24 family envelope stress response protein [Oscillospiraceae bacterium]
MADNKEYLMQEQEAGSILISEEVICTIAAAAVMEVEGVENLNANIGSDLAEMLGMKILGKGIKLTVEENRVTIACSVVLAYGYDVVGVAKKIQQSISNAVESMTGFQVQRVDVDISGVTLPKKKKAE